jgi:ribonuclease HI
MPRDNDEIHHNVPEFSSYNLSTTHAKHSIFPCKSSVVATIPAESNDTGAQSPRNSRDATNIQEPPIIATDGSVKIHRAKGTFAWALADQDGTPWLRCRRPVSGTPINSFRSEACALFYVLVYLNLMANYFTAPIPTIEIYVYTDSESNIKRINQNRHRRQHEFPNETLSPSWDLHQAIHKELIKLPNIAFRHIKAHQDQSTPNAELSQDTKLNIEADKKPIPVQPFQTRLHSFQE